MRETPRGTDGAKVPARGFDQQGVFHNEKKLLRETGI
jgi:hypothetical protein